MVGTTVISRRDELACSGVAHALGHVVTLSFHRPHLRAGGYPAIT